MRMGGRRTEVRQDGTDVGEIWNNVVERRSWGTHMEVVRDGERWWHVGRDKAEDGGGICKVGGAGGHGDEVTHAGGEWRAGISLDNRGGKR